jgi:hypothetical protein
VPPELQRWLNPRSVGGQYALATVVLTILAGASGLARANLVLVGDAVLHDLKVWTVLTNVFLVAPDPFSIIFSVLVFLWVGQFLESHWGRRRLWTFIVGIGGLSSLVIVALAAIFPSLGVLPFFGGGAIFSAMWVAQGLLLGSRQVSFFGIPLTGYALAAVGAAFPILNGLFRSPLLELQTYVALIFTVAWVRGWGPMSWVNQFRAWRLAKSLRRRSGHLTVLSGEERNPPRGSDRYLH